MISRLVLRFLFLISLLPLLSQGVAGQSTPTYEVGLQQRVDQFSEIFDAQYQTTLSLSTQRDIGNYSFQVTHAERFNDSGQQFSLISYPVFSDSYYGYLAYSFSSSTLFPDHFVGAELFSTLPGDFEASVGLRYLTFTTGAESMVFTGSLSYYYTSWLFSVRPFYIKSSNGNGQALSAFARYYLNDIDHLFIRGSYGVSPESRTLFSPNGVFTDQQLLLESTSIGAGGEYRLGDHWTLTLSLDYNSRELAFDTGNFIDIWVSQAGISYTF